MRRTLVAGLTGAIIAFTVASLQPVRAANPVTGVVNLQQLLQSYPEYQQADRQVKQAEANYQRALADRLQKLETARKQGKSAAELQRLQKQYEAEIRPIQTRGVNLYKDLQARLRGKVERAIAVVARQKGMEAVIDKSAVLYGGKDLTADVSRQLRR